MDRIADLALFLRTLDLGSISAGARSLNLSPAVGSQRLKKLEKELGVRLLHRTTRQLTATPEGALLAEQSRSLVDDLEALLSDAGQAALKVTGTLRLTMPSSFGRQYISPILPAFLNRHPKLRLSVDLTDQTTDLVGSGFDLAIRIGELESPNLVARKLIGNRRVLCASPDYLNKFGTPRTVEDLAHHECLLLAGNRESYNVWSFYDERKGVKSIRVNGRLHCNQGELLRDAALAGHGIARHSVWHIYDDLRAGRLRIVLPNDQIPDTGIYVVMPQRRLVPARVRAFVDFVTEHLGEQPPWETLSL